jgi:hypothetical protein
MLYPAQSGHPRPTPGVGWAEGLARCIFGVLARACPWKDEISGLLKAPELSVVISWKTDKAW